ncbi:MAG TPA: VTT domain-containing protein [Kofleriaceae bacterium]|jgi:uncharacterized membrane protein YdjX (TVP38/TMEM64 family)|nr:VTT domain-containing protein [Kofleriaceae bacterium]
MDSTQRRSPRPYARWVRFALAAGALAAVVYLVWSAYDHAAVMAWLRELRPLPFFAATAVLPALGIPTTPLYIFAGASFGPALGLIGSWIALAVNLVLCYGIARWLRPQLARVLRRFRTELPDLAERDRGVVKFTLGVKLAPGAPTFVKNYVLGFVGVPFKTYFAVSMLFTGVYAAAFVMMGDSLVEHELGRTAIAAGALVAAIALAIAWRRRKQRSARRAQPGPA